MTCDSARCDVVFNFVVFFLYLCYSIYTIDKIKERGYLHEKVIKFIACVVTTSIVAGNDMVGIWNKNAIARGSLSGN